MRFHWYFALSLLALLSFSRTARAETLHLPVGGKAVLIGDGRVVCEAPGQGFATDPGSRLVRPPTTPDAIGRQVEIKVAPTLQACAEAGAQVSLVAVGKVPALVPSSIWFATDEGRLDGQGENLAAATLLWRSGTESGLDTCHDPRENDGREECSWGVTRSLSVAPEVTQFWLVPAGARSIDNAIFFDRDGKRVPVDALKIVPARSTVLRLIAPDTTVDLSTGQGEIPLIHPEAVAAAECGTVSCEMVGERLIVRGASSVVSSVEVRLRLAPHVFVFRKDSFETTVSAKLLAMHCPMSIVSGQPIRDNSDAKVIVRLEGRCGAEISTLSFESNERPLRTLDTLRLEDASFAVLRLGSRHDDALTINAVRGSPNGVVVASAQTSTRPAPNVRAVLTLKQGRNLDFIPNNRWVEVHTSSAGEGQRLQLLPIDGIYDVQLTAHDHSLIRADPNAAGLTGLRFGLRTTQLPDRLNKVDLAVLSDPLQRGTGMANLPANIEPIDLKDKPLVTVACGGNGKDPLREVPIGATAYLRYAQRDTCRVMFHRERLPEELGMQKFQFEVEVTGANGAPKPTGRVNEVITLRHGETPRYAWISGVTDPFDRVTIRVTHVADENHYVGADEIRTGAPSAQWSMVLGGGRVRIYAATTVPTGLYRFAGKKAYTGPLNVSFGVISRLTWLNAEGREGLLGAEAGVLVFGLANSQSQANTSLTQIGAVLGLGLSVPVGGNRTGPAVAAINVHAWYEINLTADEEAARHAFVFGPSISIGNVGVNL